MSLRERLEGKAVRRITVHVMVGNPEPLQQAYETALAAFTAATVNTDATPAERDECEAAVGRALEALAGTVVAVEFQKLPDDAFEALVAEHTVMDEEHGAVVDRGGLLPVLAAECAVDESLRDADWWRGLVAGEAWSRNEREGLYFQLFSQLNYSPPSGVLGKG